MKFTARVREVYKRVPNRNPLCRAAFDEVGKPIAWEVVGILGVTSRHKVEAAAIKAAEELQKFYDKFFNNVEGS